jgi:hypothetical protein
LISSFFFVLLSIKIIDKRKKKKKGRSGLRSPSQIRQSVINYRLIRQAIRNNPQKLARKIEKSGKISLAG